MRIRRSKFPILSLIMAFVLPLLVSGCGSMRSHWGVEGDLPFGDSHYYYEQDHHHKDKKHKKHKKHKKYKKHHHDDDDFYNIDDSDASPYNELNNVPI